MGIPQYCNSSGHISFNQLCQKSAMILSAQYRTHRTPENLRLLLTCLAQQWDGHPPGSELKDSIPERPFVLWDHTTSSSETYKSKGKQSH